MDQSPKNEEPKLFLPKGALALLFFFAVFGFLLADQTGSFASVRSFLLAQAGQPVQFSFELDPNPPEQGVVTGTNERALGGFYVNNNTGAPLRISQSKVSFLVGGSPGKVTDLDQVFLYSTSTINAWFGIPMYPTTDSVDVPPSGTVTFGAQPPMVIPVGRHYFYIIGSVPALSQGQTVQALISPSQWLATNENTGQPVTLSGSALFLTPLTLTRGSGSAELGIFPSWVSGPYGVSAGGTNVLIETLQLSTFGSGEDVHFTSIPLQLQTPIGNSYPRNCKFYDLSSDDGHTPISTYTMSGGGTVDGLWRMGIDLSMEKESVKLLELDCDIPLNAVLGDTFRFTLATTSTASMAGVGLVSGSPFTVNLITNNNAGKTNIIRAAASSSLSVSLDSSSPAYRTAVAGVTNQTTSALRFTVGGTTGEAVSLNRIALQLSGSAASSSPSDIVRTTIWDGNTQVGEALFVGTTRYATSTLITPVTIPQGSSKVLIIRTDLSNIGAGQPGRSGAFIRVDYDGTDATGTRGTGMNSGTTLYSTTRQDSFSQGFRMFKSVPTLSTDSLPTTGLNDGRFLRFKVTADSHGDVVLGKLTLRITTASTTLPTGPVLYGYTDSAYSNPISGVGVGGIVADTTTYEALDNTSTIFSFYPKTSMGATTTVVVPAGQTRYFEFRGKVSVKKGGGSVTAQLLGDSAYPALSNTMLVGVMGPWSVGVDSPSNAAIRNFIWSGDATSTIPLTTDQAWSNGYGVPGLPATGLIQTRTGNPPKGK